METLDDILNEAIKASGATSQADFARKIGVSHPTITNWKTGRSTPDAYALMQLQKILKKDARELLAIIEAERAKDEKRREYWQDVKKSFRSTTATALAALAIFLAIGQPNKAEAAANMAHSLHVKCILCQVHMVYLDPDRRFALAIISPENRDFLT